MKGSATIFGVYTLIIVMVIVFGSTCNAQTLLNDKTFYKSQEGLTIVEFWAEWNKNNECVWIKDIEDATYYRINLDSDAAKNYEIKVLPTLIVFNNGEEIKRFEGNLSFKLCPKSTPKKVKKIVKKVLISKI